MILINDPPVPSGGLGMRPKLVRIMSKPQRCFGFFFLKKIELLLSHELCGKGKEKFVLRVIALICNKV